MSSAVRIHRITGVRLWFIPVATRMPLKFGPEVLTSVTCARVCLRVADGHGREAEGWGETPLSVQWVWPSAAPYSERHDRLLSCCRQLARSWASCPLQGHPLTVGWHFQEQILPGLRHSPGPSPIEPLPHLAALVCNSPFDIALHDAFARLVKRPVFDTYGPDLLSEDLACFLSPAPDATNVSFHGKFPRDFLLREPARQLPAWHLVGGVDPLEAADLTGQEPRDGYPVLLRDWIRHDGLRCLKVKLRGNDASWDFERLARVGSAAHGTTVQWLSADFNCTVQQPAYVLEVLDRLKSSCPDIFDRLLYVEQPFPYDLQAYPINVHAISAVKPLFLDESAHDWRLIRLGRELGWNGVALKTCKTQTGAVLAACWSKAHGMKLMVQDLTNPMLAQIPHVQLAAYVGTIMGVETNAMQFYPAASEPEAKVHPGLYRRRNGIVDLSSIHGPGFGYRLEEMNRPLPAPDLHLT